MNDMESRRKTGGFLAFAEDIRVESIANKNGLPWDQAGREKQSQSSTEAYSCRKACAAAHIFFRDATVSGQLRVFSPQSGLTHSCSGRTASNALRRSCSISSFPGMRVA